MNNLNSFNFFYKVAQAVQKSMCKNYGQPKVSACMAWLSCKVKIDEYYWFRMYALLHYTYLGSID
jgi:hypothetical protein